METQSGWLQDINSFHIIQTIVRDDTLKMVSKEELFSLVVTSHIQHTCSVASVHIPRSRILFWMSLWERTLIAFKKSICHFTPYIRCLTAFSQQDWVKSALIKNCFLFMQTTCSILQKKKKGWMTCSMASSIRILTQNLLSNDETLN